MLLMRMRFKLLIKYQKLDFIAVFVTPSYKTGPGVSVYILWLCHLLTLQNVMPRSEF